VVISVTDIQFISFSVVLLFNGFTVFLRGNWNPSSFVASYIGKPISSEYGWPSDTTGLPVFFFSWLGWKLVKKTKFVRLADIDFVTGMRELDAMEAEDLETYKPDTPWKKFVSVLF
jgi:amino acid transporter